jgi:hypothetical protein
MYTYDWVLDAFNEAAKKNKYSTNYVEGILKAWTREGKEDNHGGTRPNNADSTGKYTGFKPPEPNIPDNLDTSDII